MAGNGNKIDSNFTGLRYTEEVSGAIGTLPGSPVWKSLEANSYGDFGAQVTTIARTPITAGRQREKGVVTDVDASAGANIDFTQDNFVDLMQGFFFADWRAQPFKDGGSVASTGVDFGTTPMLRIATGDLIFLTGFDESANKGLKVVTTTSSTRANFAGSIVENPAPNNSYSSKVGVECGSGDLDVDVSGAYPALVSTTYDFTTLGVIAGSWVYIGGDASVNEFANANNNGFARVRSVAVSRLELDKTQNTMTAETGAGKSVRIFAGDLIRNENDPALIKCRSYQFERSLSSAGFEYVKGCVGNTFTLNMATADKVNADIAFIGTDAEAVEVANRKSGTFPDIATSATAFNTSSDFSRIRLAKQDSLGTPLMAYLTEFSLTVNNNVSPAKAIGTLGAFDMNVGDFVAEGNVTAFFADIESINAIRANADVSMDFCLAKGNAGWVFDLPLLTLGEGRLAVEKDSPVTIPVSIGGARDPHLNTTLQAAYFPYLPTAAEG